MKRVFVLLAVGLFLMTLAPAIAVAQGEPTKVWMDDPQAPGTWPDAWSWGDEAALARVQRLGQLIDSSCNKMYWYIDINVHASVAQWVKWSLTHQGWGWEVKKPGCYATNCISFVIASNGDIYLDYRDFDDLKSVAGSTHNELIEAYYSFGEDVFEAENAGWVRAIDMVAIGKRLIEQELVDPFNLHRGITYKLWNKICVVDCNTACEYSDEGQIVLTLEGQKDWLDRAGNWIW